VDRREALRDFVKQNFLVAGPLSDDESLLDHGVIDSTGVLEVVGFLESEYQILVADEEIVPGNFDSVAALAAYVERKQAAA
jgi:acyl carrier protein